MSDGIDLGALKADLQKYAKIWASTCAHEAANGITDMAKMAVAQFYGAYSPVVYRRTGNISGGSYSKYLKNNGRIYYGGVGFSSSGMGEYAHAGISTDEIYSRVIFSGLHGKVASAAPYNIVSAIYNNPVFMNQCDEAGHAAARSAGYSILSF